MQHPQVATVTGMMEAVNASDAKRYAFAYTKDAVIVIHGSAVLRGRDAIEGYEVELLREFPGARLAFHAMWQAGPAAVVRYAVTGQGPGGRWMGHEGLLFFRFDASGLVQEEHRYLDSLTPMAQMGLLTAGPARPLPALRSEMTLHVAEGSARRRRTKPWSPRPSAPWMRGTRMDSCRGSTRCRPRRLDPTGRRRRQAERQGLVREAGRSQSPTRARGRYPTGSRRVRACRKRRPRHAQGSPRSALAFRPRVRRASRCRLPSRWRRSDEPFDLHADRKELAEAVGQWPPPGMG
jgi:nuclear transport factor 2 (NTF2) superfamily protein